MMWVWKRPIVIDMRGLDDGGRDCECGHRHYPGSRTFETHADRLRGRLVMEMLFSWPADTGFVQVREIERK